MTQHLPCHLIEERYKLLFTCSAIHAVLEITRGNGRTWRESYPSLKMHLSGRASLSLTHLLPEQSYTEQAGTQVFSHEIWSLLVGYARLRAKHEEDVLVYLAFSLVS